MGSASRQLGIRVDDPLWIELPNDREESYIEGI